MGVHCGGGTKGVRARRGEHRRAWLSEEAGQRESVGVQMTEN